MPPNEGVKMKRTYLITIVVIALISVGLCKAAKRVELIDENDE